MKRMTYLPLALLLVTPTLASAGEIEGEVNLGLRTTHISGGDRSAKYDEYLDQSDGLFGGGWVFYDAGEYNIGASLDNSGLEVTGGKVDLFKGTLYYDEYTHMLSRNALTPITGIGSNYLTIPDADLPATVPPVSSWEEFDYKVDKKVYGGEVTIDTGKALYYKLSMEQQESDGTMPYGGINFSDFELPMPVDYTTTNFMAESGYRSKERTAVLSVGYSEFDNDNDLFSTYDGTELQEYSTPADNYSYNIGGRLTQRLPMSSLLALKGSYTRNVSDPDFGDYTTITSPTADGDYDGDVQYMRASMALTTRFDNSMDTRLFYNYVDRDNESDEISASGTENELYEYTKHQAGLDFNYRLNRKNKLQSGYEFTSMDRSREDSDSSTDNLIFAQLNNTTLDWMSTKFRLEYLNRDTDSDYSAATLAGDGLIHEYFTAYDVASKDRYKAKMAFEFYPTDGLDMGLSYAFVYDDYDTSLGVQDERRHEIYLDANMVLESKIRLNTYAGYEYTESDYDARRYNPGGADPNGLTDANNYNWSNETTYDFFALGGSVTVPVYHNFEVVLSADYQVVDGNIDFDRPAAAGVPLETINDADDYYKTELGLKTMYKATENLSVTVGYVFEKSNLDDWELDNYTYTPGSDYLSGAYTDSDYETHRVYVISTYRF